MPDAIVFGFVLVIIIQSIACAPASGNISENISGQALYDVGSLYNISILKVIGAAMNKLEKDLKEEAEKICRLHPCTEWTTWSYCDVSADKYRRVGTQYRSRNCGGNTTICERYGISTLVYDHKVCEKYFCPDDYNVTQHGFCLKYYPGLKNWTNAENVCRNDGGHLVNVDSEIKAYDVNSTLAASALNSVYRIWIDGRRSSAGSSWEYGYKSSDSSFTYWSVGRPGSSHCIMYYKTSANNYMWRWYDHTCSVCLPFVCQILLVQ